MLNYIGFERQINMINLRTYTLKDVKAIVGVPKTTLNSYIKKGTICKSGAKDKYGSHIYSEEDIHKLHMKKMFDAFGVAPSIFNEIYEDVSSMHYGTVHKMDSELFRRLQMIACEQQERTSYHIKVLDEAIKYPEKFSCIYFNPDGLDEYILKEDRRIIDTIRSLPVECQERLDDAINGYVKVCSELFKADVTIKEISEKHKEEFCALKNVIEDNLAPLSVYLSTQLLDNVFTNEYLGTEMTPDMLEFIKLPFLYDAEEKTFRLCEALLFRFSRENIKSKKGTVPCEQSVKKMNYDILVKGIDNEIIKKKGAERRVYYLRNLETLLLRWEHKDLKAMLGKRNCVQIAEAVGNHWTKITCPHQGSVLRKRKTNRSSFRKSESMRQKYRELVKRD